MPAGQDSLEERVSALAVGRPRRPTYTAGRKGDRVCHIRKKLRLPATGAGSITSLQGVGYSLIEASAAPAPPDAPPAVRLTCGVPLAVRR